MAGRQSYGDGSIFFDEDRQQWVGLLELPDDGTGKRRRTKVRGRTKTEVRERLRERQRLLEQSLPAGAGDLTVEALLRRWLDEVLPARQSVTSPSTLANYRWAAERQLIPRIGTKRLRTLTADDVERALRRMADEGMARNSIVRARSTLHMAIKWAQRRELVNRNVAAIAEIPASAARPRQGRSLTVDEAKALLATAAGHRLGPLVTTSLMLGLRPGEVTGLRWEDVDLHHGVLHVRQARKREPGRDGSETLTFGRPKTPKSVRSIELPSPVTSSLRLQRQLQRAERHRTGHRWQEHDLVFTTTVGTPIGPNNLRRDFAALTQAAGLGVWTPNELRHSAGSLLSAAGVPLEQIADLLGHTDTRMLERVYRHPVRPTVRAAVEPMEQLFGHDR